MCATRLHEVRSYLAMLHRFEVDKQDYQELERHCEVSFGFCCIFGMFY